MSKVIKLGNYKGIEFKVEKYLYQMKKLNNKFK